MLLFKKNNIKWEFAQKVFIIGLVFECFALIFFTYSISENTYLMKYKREDMPQYQFAKTINKVEDPKILNYGFLDGGFYFAANVIPDCKYFCTLNNNLPEMYEEQNAYVEKGLGDFIITRSTNLEDYNINTQYYQCVDQSSFYFEGSFRTYFLYQKMNSNKLTQMGWIKNGSDWYYLNSYDDIKIGWINDGGSWYYTGSNGAMCTGWINDKGTVYFMGSNGVMTTGWLNINDNWFYLKKDGAMVTGTYMIDGKKNKFDTSGIWKGAIN